MIRTEAEDVVFLQDSLRYFKHINQPYPEFASLYMAFANKNYLNAFTNRFPLPNSYYEVFSIQPISSLRYELFSDIFVMITNNRIISRFDFDILYSEDYIGQTILK